VILAPTSFPEWLPPAVAKEAEELAQERPEHEELLRRLATDPRMESVWREIKKHNSSEHIDWERWSNERKPTGLSNEDIALKLTFRYVYFRALHVIHEEITIPTIAEHKALIASWEQQAARLRAEAAKLRERGNDAGFARAQRRVFEEHAEAAERAAARCERGAADLITWDPADPNTPMIERDKGWRREMMFADMLATHVMQPLYGMPLYGTVATITNVALATRSVVEARHVRDWLKGLRKPRPMRIRTPTVD
jgi:hypothetical protein